MPQAAFDRIGNDHRRWISLANDLLRASVALRERTPFEASAQTQPGGDVVRPMLLLRAFALEGFFKAMWLRAGNVLAVAGQFEKVPGIDNHNLVELATRVGFTLKLKERECLSRLTHFGVFGRYPINRNWQLQEGKSFWGTADEGHWDAIIKRVDVSLRK